MSEETKKDLVTRLTSRKLWLTVLVGAVITLGDAIGLNLDAEELYALVGLAGAYSVGNGLGTKK